MTEEQELDGPDVLTQRSGAVLTVTLNRPTKLNSLTPRMLDELTQVWQDAADPEVRAVIVTGAGRGFCAGADIASSQSGTGRPTGLRARFNPSILALAALEKPVIAAINGPVAGAGLGIMAAADIIVAADTARFIPAFDQVGVVPDGGASYFLVRLLGYAKTFEWLSSGRRLGPDEALSLGVVHDVVPSGDLISTVNRRAEAMAGSIGDGIGLTKAMLAAAYTSSLPESLELEVAFQARALRARPDRAELAAKVLGNKGN
jgi:2-(1,2-epoxy-1,2-dihydrophenyl)acetyl-CoA isomerase